MKKAAFLLLILCVGMFVPAHSQSPRPKNLFFVIDVSGSMEKSQIFKPLKMQIEDKIREWVNKGDYVAIISFGTDVKIIDNRQISAENTVEDIQSVQRQINGLKAREQYTHMTKALDILASQMKQAGALYPNRDVMAFLWTDGKNEPPPGAEGAAWTFEDILQKHYDIFDNPETFLYIVTLGIQPDEELIKATAGKKNIVITSVPDISNAENFIPPGTKPEPKEATVQLDISGPEKIRAKAKSQYDLVIHVNDLNQEAIGKMLGIEIVIDPPLDLLQTKKELELRKGVKEKIPVLLKKPTPGDYTIKVNLSSKDGVNISSPGFEKRFTITKPNYSLYIILLAIAVTALGVWTYIRRIPKFTDDHVVVDTREGLTYELKEKQKWYSSTVTSKNLGIADAEFSLRIDGKTGEVLCRALIEGEWTDKIIQNGETIIDPYKFEVRMI